MAATSSGRVVPAEGSHADGSLLALAAAARPKQWIKNLVLPLPFLFGGALETAEGWVLAAAGFAAFSAIASGIYLVNDVMDRERDRAHPEKRHRPLASGRLSVPAAVTGRSSSRSAASRAPSCSGRRSADGAPRYAALMLAYSFVLKRIPFLEALIVAAGMPLRALAGAALAGVLPSLFLIVCAYLLALFLVAGKRQWEFHHAGLPVAPRSTGPALAAYARGGPRLPLHRDGPGDGVGIQRLQRHPGDDRALSAARRSRRRFRSSCSASRATFTSSTAAAEGATPPRPSSWTIRGSWSS